jgi:uroporphyrinogen-III synthase
LSHWLTGQRVVVTRPHQQAQELCQRLHALGAEPILFPVIAIAPAENGGPLDQAIIRLADYDWVIFTSVNGVEHFWARLAEHSSPQSRPTLAAPNLKIAAIGPITAESLRQRGVPVHLMPDEYRAEAILGVIGDVAGQRILLPRADIARPALANGLRAMGALVEDVAAYRTVKGTPPPAAFDALCVGVDVVTFTSSSTVRNFVLLTNGLDYGRPLIACIGPVTAATALEVGLPVDVVAEAYTIDGLLEALKSAPNVKSQMKERSRV